MKKLLLLITGWASALNLLVLNDVHLGLDETGVPRLGGNTSKELFALILAKAQKEEKIDAILLAGDNCMHGEVNEGGSEILYKTIAAVSEMVATHFPEIPIINSIGNNDVLSHN